MRDGISGVEGSDEFVVYQNDPFSPTVLWAMAHAWEIVLEVNARTGVLTELEQRRIESLAEKAAEKAMEWSIDESITDR